jgi:hypothetical protein
MDEYSIRDCAGSTLPMIVYGPVTLNGSPAADGHNIAAWDNGGLGRVCIN